MDQSPSVQKILKDNYVDDAHHTHVSLLQPRGKFQFNRLGLETFWEAYCKLIKNVPESIVGVAEKPRPYLSVLADVDLKIKDTNQDYGEHLYSEDHVIQIIEIYQSILRNIVDNCTDDLLMCVLLEKPIYTITAGETTYVKNGFHLHFPNLFLSKIDQEVHLIPRVQKVMKEMNVLADIGIEDSSSVIDKSCCIVPWLLYGSRKAENMEPYRVTKIFDSERTELDLETAFENYEIFDDRENPIVIKGRVEEYLPRILSIIPYGRNTQELKSGLISPLKAALKQKQHDSKTNTAHMKLSVTENLKIAARLLPMLADFRTEDRNEWMTVGWALYNIGEGCTEALDLWLEFSARSEEKYDEASCIYEWDRMIVRDKTMGTLRHYAKNDSPDLYNEFKREQAEPLMKDSLNGSHNDIAKLLHVEYGDEFVCASISGKTWYQFRKSEHRWEEIEEGIFLRERISDKIVDRYTKLGEKSFADLASAKDKAEEAMYNARMKQLQKMIGNLKSSPFKNNVMKEAQEVFYNRKFKEKLDQNPFLIGFKNGVYDLKINQFRDGTPEDYISKTLPIDYQEYNESDKAVQDVKEFLHKVFPDSSVRTYFMDMYSDIFVGGNTQKKVLMWTGEGDNAKSVTQNFFEKMLGELAIKFNTQYFTGKKTSTGSANPELARAAPPVRHATMEEPDADEQLNIGELKKLSGGDSYWARDLFEKGKSTREVFPMFMLTFICNKLPKLKYSDKATWNRIRVIPFESTFVPPGEPCPDTFEEQLRQKRFPMDKSFNEKVPGMVQAFAWYLLQWRQKITVRIEPDKVKEATAVYRRQNDIYRQFIEECIVEDNGSLSLIEMYAQFKEWFKEGFPNMTLPIKNEVKEYFERLWGDADPGVRWSGYRIRTLQDDVDDGEAIILDDEDLVNYDDDGNCLPPM